ncbi:hypothetical protein TanjilG_03637 [Lupinus angustifolius]|uniref:Uncharacterized protein n=1 Tax=Lupinus angustifolius TaxID=3871 RepID=A0A1J7GXD5_LUPAN|nr:hypothetical protein TanjilG_03637 [Lupinus angustifolius]
MMTKSNSSSENNGLKKGPWTPEEDQKLIDYIQQHGHGKWRILPKNAGLKRCGKSCRLRWANYLRPDIKRGKFSLEEEETIIQLHSVMGNKWSTIATNLPGRTDNEIKNYWNTHIKKKLLNLGIDPITHTPHYEVLQHSSILNSLYSPQLNYSSSPFRIDCSSSVVNNQSQLLSLLTTFLSYQNRNQDIMNHNFHQNQIGISTSSPLLQNQSQCSHPMQLNSIQNFRSNQVQVQENHQPCATSNDPLHVESQLMKIKLENQISSIVATPFSHQDNTSIPNLWQYEGGYIPDQQQQPQSISTMQSLSLPKFNSIVNNLLENQISSNNNEGMPNFNRIS